MVINMTHLKSVRFFAASLALACMPTLAQQVNVQEISDKRTTGQFFAGLEVKLALVGAGIPEARGVRRVKIERAVDDTGRNLIKEERFAKTPFDSVDASPSRDTLRVELELANPSRQAKTIQELTGYVELHTPHLDPKSVLTFGPVSGLYGKKLPLPASLNGKLSITPINKAIFDENRKANASGGDGELVQAFKQLFSVGMDADTLGFLMQGDVQQVAAVEILDAQGKVLKQQSRSSSGGFVGLSFPGGVGAGAQIRVYLATPKSVTRLPIQMKAVALP